MKIGKVISVEYDRFKIRLFQATKSSTINIKGDIYYFGNIGSYLKTYNSVGNEIICEVVAVLDHSLESQIYSSYNLDSTRELIIKPIGTLYKDAFAMGIGIYPSIYSDVSIVTIYDLDKILSSTKGRVNGIHSDIEIGYSKNLINYRVKLDINRLFNIHTAVLGNSGSGKSNTIATILQKVFQKKDNHAEGAKIILFDTNGEYRRAFETGLFKDISLIFYKPNVENGPFYLPYFLMNLDEWLAFLMASDRTQKPFWDRVLQESFKFYKIFGENNSEEQTQAYVNYFKWKIIGILRLILSQVDSDTAKVTAARGVILKCNEITNKLSKNKALADFLRDASDACPLSFGNNNDSLSTFLQGVEIDEEEAFSINSQRLYSGEYFDYKFLSTAVEMVLLEEEAKGNSRIREFTSTMISRLDYFLYNPDCAFMKIEDSAKYKDSKNYLEKVFGISDNKKENQLIIIDSSEVGNDILELMTSVVCRMIYDYRKKKEGDLRRKSPVHLILDEAHRYIKKDSYYILRDNIFEKIAREGRKFSLYLIVSSQRPSELSTTVLSQCGNYIIHRIQNEVDMKYIYSVLPYFSDGYTSKIKQAVPGEALVFGNCVPMPLQIQIDKAVPDPNSENCKINEEWFCLTNTEE